MAVTVAFWVLPSAVAVPAFAVQDAGIPLTTTSENRLVAVVPFAYREGHIAVYLTVGESTDQLRFVVDSGASFCVIDSAVAERLNLRAVPVRPRQKVAGYGSQAVSMKQVNDFQATLWANSGTTPILAMPTMNCVSLPVAAMGEKDAPIDGLLGYDFFIHYVVEINYEKNEMRLYEPKSFAYRGAGRTLPIQFDNRIPSVYGIVKQKNREPFRTKLILDTGNAGSILLHRPVSARMQLTEGIPTVPVENQGIGGTEPASMGRLESFTLADHAIPSPLTYFSAATIGNGGASKDRDGSIGNDILRRFTVTFDFTRDQAYLEPNSRLNEITPSNRYLCGWLTEKDEADAYRITGITPGSAAEAAGLQIGDVLTAVDNKPIPEAGLRVVLYNARSHQLTYKRDGNIITVPFQAWLL